MYNLNFNCTISSNLILDDAVFLQAKSTYIANCHSSADLFVTNLHKS